MVRLRNVAGAPVRPATFLILHTDILTYMHTCVHAHIHNKYTIIIASVPTHNFSCTHMHTLIHRYSLFPIGTMNADDDDADADNDDDADDDHTLMISFLHAHTYMHTCIHDHS